jgi:hypothetical protein
MGTVSTRPCSNKALFALEATGLRLGLFRFCFGGSGIAFTPQLSFDCTRCLSLPKRLTCAEFHARTQRRASLRTTQCNQQHTCTRARARALARSRRRTPSKAAHRPAPRCTRAGRAARPPADSKTTRRIRSSSWSQNTSKPTRLQDSLAHAHARAGSHVQHQRCVKHWALHSPTADGALQQPGFTARGLPSRAVGSQTRRSRRRRRSAP